MKKALLLSATLIFGINMFSQDSYTNQHGSMHQTERYGDPLGSGTRNPYDQPNPTQEQLGFRKSDDIKNDSVLNINNFIFGSFNNNGNIKFKNKTSKEEISNFNIDLLNNQLVVKDKKTFKIIDIKNIDYLTIDD